MAGRPENLLPGGGGIERGVPFGAGHHRTCKATTKKGAPCNAVAVTGSPFCKVHGGLGDRPEQRAKAASVRAARHNLTQARHALGGTLPRDLAEHPAYARRGRALETLQRRADLARAYALIPEDGGAEWRAAIARWGN